MSYMNSVLKKAVKVVVAALVISAILIITAQDVFIFPGAYHFFSPLHDDLAELPARVEKLSVPTSDGENLLAWKLDPPDGISKRGAAVIFRGNDGPLGVFFPVQKWAAEHGLVAYLFNYRGYSGSSGWPSAQGVLLDGEAIAEFARKNDSFSSDQLFLIGISLGTGPASELAIKIRPQGLFLISGYTSILDAVRSKPFIKLLSPFLRTNFQTEVSINQLEHGCFIVAHGDLDELLPLKLHGEPLYKAYHGDGFHTFITDNHAGHVNVFDLNEALFSQALENCFKL